MHFKSKINILIILELSIWEFCYDKWLWTSLIYVPNPHFILLCTSAAKHHSNILIEPIDKKKNDSGTIIQSLLIP